MLEENSSLLIVRLIFNLEQTLMRQYLLGSLSEMAVLGVSHRYIPGLLG